MDDSLMPGIRFREEDTSQALPLFSDTQWCYRVGHLDNTYDNDNSRIEITMPSMGSAKGNLPNDEDPQSSAIPEKCTPKTVNSKRLAFPVATTFMKMTHL